MNQLSNLTKTANSTLNSPFKVIKHSFGFAIDIDGTLTISHKPIPGAKQTLQILQHKNIPFVLLTNNIAQSQAARANQLSKFFQLQRPLSAQQIVLGFSPIKHIFLQKPEEIVLIVGLPQRLDPVLPLPFIKRYMTVDQYCSIFPESVPYVLKKQCKTTLETVKQRLGVTQLNLKQLRFGSVFILTPPARWQQHYQILIDVLSTKQGRVTNDSVYSHIKDHIPVFSVFNDLFFFSSHYHLPRLLIRPFNEGLKAVYKSIYQEDIHIQCYGKPYAFMFEYAHKQLQEAYGGIQKMVMIGDNLEVDIEGAHKVGWDTILVKTGVNKVNSQLATINSQDIRAGVVEYFKKHGVDL